MDQRNTWFRECNAQGRLISTNIFKGSFVEPLPVLQDGQSIVAMTSDESFLYILKVSCNSVVAIGIGGAFSDNAIDEIFFHSAMVCRDSTDDISVRCYLYEECNDETKKLLVMSAYNKQYETDINFVPSQLALNRIPQVIDAKYLLNVGKIRGAKLPTRSKKIPLFCCCRRPHFLLSEERNKKLLMDKMIECTSCRTWYFFTCVAATETSGEWYCKDCTISLPDMFDHCSLHSCRFTNSCPIDSLITACSIFNEQNNNALLAAIDTYDKKNVFEDALQVLLASDISTPKSMQDAKHIFLKKIFDKQRDLEGDEENIVLRHFKDRYLLQGRYDCQQCHENGTTVAEDCLYFERILFSVEESFNESLQPESMSLVKVCCEQVAEVIDKRFVADIPWVLPLRPLAFPVLRELTPQKLELVPLKVDVLNNNEIITYKLGLISFSQPNHFSGLIPSKQGWILYDGLKKPQLLPLREAIQRITERNALINVFYYFALNFVKKKKNTRGKLSQLKN